MLHRDLAVLGVEAPEGAADQQPKELGQLELRVRVRTRAPLARLVGLQELRLHVLERVRCPIIGLEADVDHKVVKLVEGHRPSRATLGVLGRGLPE